MSFLYFKYVACKPVRSFGVHVHLIRPRQTGVSRGLQRIGQERL